MPWIVAQQHDVSEAPTASLEIELPTTPAVNDVICICATNDGGATTIAATGYSGPAQAANQGVRVAWLFKVSDGTETSVTVTGANDDWIYSLYIVRGCNVSGTPWIASSRQDWATARFVDSVSFDATSAGDYSLLFYSWGHDTSTTAQYQWISPSDLEVDASIYGASINHICGHRTLPIAGNAPTVRMYPGQNSDGGNGWVIAMIDANAATTSPYAQYSYTGMLDIIRMCGSLGKYLEIDTATVTTFTATGVASTDVFTATGWTPVDGTNVVFRSVTGGGTNVVNTSVRYVVRDASGQTFKIASSLAESGAYGTALNITADVTASTIMIVDGYTIERANNIAATISGVSTLDAASTWNWNTSISGLSGITGDNIYSAVSTAGAWAGATYVYTTPFDMSGNRIFSIDWSTDANWTGSRQLSKGAIVVFSDGTNWIAYQLSTKSGAVNNQRNISYIALGQATAFDSSGTMNWASVSKIGIYLHRGGSSTTGNSITVRCLVLFKEGIVCGGCADNPANAYNMKSAMGVFGFDHLWDNAGIAQSVDRVPYKIGCGERVFYWDSSVGSQENPNTFLPNNQIRKRWNVNAGYSHVKIDACDACNFIAESCIFAGKNNQKVIIDAGSSASAIYNVAGATFSGKQIINDGNINLAGFIAKGCPQIDGGTATYTDVVVSESTATGSSALKLEGGGKALSCSFTKGAETYAIEIAGNGPIAIDISGSTFSGYTNVINLTGTTGVVTITLALGQTQPTYVTAGATVTWDQAVAPTTWTNADLADGTTILVRNVTTSSTIVYVASLATGSGYTITMTPGVHYTVGDELAIWQSRKDGTTYYQERTSRIITSGAGGSIVEADPLAVCPVCTAFGLDGAVPPISTKFSADYTDDEIDINVGAPWQMAEAMVWSKTQMTVQASMEDLWGTLLVQADGSFYNPDQDTKLVLFDNVTTSDAIESTGARFYNQSGIRPIKSPTTASGAIDLAWREPVTVVATGSGVLPSDITAIAEAVNNTSTALTLGQFVALK